jgi:hypothetical protein
MATATSPLTRRRWSKITEDQLRVGVQESLKHSILSTAREVRQHIRLYGPHNSGEGLSEVYRPGSCGLSVPAGLTTMTTNTVYPSLCRLACIGPCPAPSLPARRG